MAFFRKGVFAYIQILLNISLLFHFTTIDAGTNFEKSLGRTIFKIISSLLSLDLPFFQYYSEKQFTHPTPKYISECQIVSWVGHLGKCPFGLCSAPFQSL